MPLSLHQVHRLQSQFESISEIISGTNKDRLHFHPLPGKWSIHDNIAHLACYNPVFISRIQKILLENEPSFGRYKAEEDPEFPGWQKKSTEELLVNLKSDREKNFHLAQSISDDGLNRIGVHPRFGRMDVKGWIEFFLLHEAHHIFTIFQLARDVNTPPPGN